MPQRHVQSTEFLDTLTVVDRQEVDTATHFTKPVAIAKKPEVSVHTVDDVYFQVCMCKHSSIGNGSKIRIIIHEVKKMFFHRPLSNEN